MKCPKCEHVFSDKMLDCTHFMAKGENLSLCGKNLNEFIPTTSRVFEVNCGWCLKILDGRVKKYAKALEELRDLHCTKAKEFDVELGKRLKIRESSD